MYKLRGLLFLIAALSSRAIGQDWITPQPGWLYVLDAENGGGGGNIFLVHPEAGLVRGSLTTDYHPIFGLCPDGSRLYVVDGPQALGALCVFDTKTGRLLSKVPLPDRVVYGVWPALPGIGCSGDSHLGICSDDEDGLSGCRRASHCGYRCH